MNTESKNIARNSVVIAGATLLSRCFGFLRDVVMAFTLGAGYMADAFFVAFRIPNLFRRLFGEGSLTMAFIPVFTKIREEQGEAAAQAMARSALLWLVLLLVCITVLAEIFAGGIVHVVAPGFSENPELMQATVLFLRICFPYVLLISAVALCMGILNASGQFFAPALAPVMLNISLISAALIGYFLGLSVAECIAWGVLAGGVLQWQLQQPYLRKQGFSWRGAWSWRDAGVRRMAVLMLPTVFGAAVYQLNIVLGTLLASFLPEGSVSYLYYADRLLQFPLGVFGIAVSTAALPSLSSLAACGEKKQFACTLRSSLGLSLFIALPASAGLAALAEPIIALLFGRGAFTPEAVSSTAKALLAYSAGLPFIAVSRPLVAAFYAMQDTRRPVLIASCCLVVNIALGLLLMNSLLHIGLALAVSISSACNALLLWFGFTRLHTDQKLLPTSFIKSVLLSAMIFAGAWITRENIWLCVACLPVWIVSYFSLARYLKMEEAILFWEALRRRKAHKKRA